jgi:hypothetical protein
VNDDLTTPYFTLKGGGEGGSGSTDSYVGSLLPGRAVREQGTSLGVGLLHAVDNSPRTDYFAAKRVVLSGTGGPHLVKLRTLWTLLRRV